ncbi:MAG: metallophosphoesterase [Anaerolineae bacterium]|nr:metallophosphoesterase [Anaerolineae bacterium]
MSAVYAIGDIHGQYDKLVSLLHDAGLVDESLRWNAGDARVWFMGDFVDRGPSGIDAIELVMRLQNQAVRAGGLVQALLGNHDLLLLAAYRFGQCRSLFINLPASPQEFPIEMVDFFTAEWLHSGGVPEDLARMNGRHAVWLAHLPAMACVEDKLLVHADATLYQRYGDTIAEVNAFFQRLLSEGDANRWMRVLDDFGEHRAFLGPDAVERAALFLKMFGCRQLIHGHTPISKITRQEATEPYVYAGGLCVNLDGGLYLGGSGFVYQLN